MNLEQKFKVTFEFWCRDPDGSLAWHEVVECDDHKDGNGNTTAGLNSILSVYLASGTQITTWYLGLVDSAAFSTYAAADTMSSHSGWAESTAYSESVRQTWTAGTVASGSVSNSASLATFTINATVTMQGAFLVSNSTKAGTTGTLFATGSFASAQSLVSGQTLTVKCTISAV